MKKVVENYQIDDFIINDAYTSFYRGLDLAKNNSDILIRVVEVQKILSIIDEPLKLIKEEVDSLSKYNNPYFIKLIQVLATKNNFYFIYEGCGDGGFLENIINQRKFMPEFEALEYLQHIFNGYKYFYDNKIIQKSIRMNSLILKNKIAKFMDLGLIKNFEKHNKDNRFVNDKFLRSLAPEIYYGKENNDKCDIFSIGTIFYRMLYGEDPWTGNTTEEYFQNVMTKALNFNNKYQKLTKYTEWLMVKMLDRNIKTRISWKDIYDDDILRTFNMTESKINREFRLLDKIQRKPDCWQVASMKLTDDPLIQLGSILKTRGNSVFQIANKAKISPNINLSLAQISTNDLYQKNELSSGSNLLQSKIIGKPTQLNKSSIQMNQNGINYSNTLEPSVCMQSSIAQSRINLGSTKLEKVDPTKSQINLGNLNNVVKPQNSNIIQQINNKTVDLFQKFLQKNEIISEAQQFDENNSRIMKLLNKLLLYSIAATTATKLFRTDLIVLQCFFLYKKLYKSLIKLSTNLREPTNILNLKLWNDYQFSEDMQQILQLLDDQIIKIKDIFEKLYKDCAKKIDILKFQQIELESISKYINLDYNDADEVFNFTMFSYLDKFLMTAENIVESGYISQFLKHKIQIVVCLLISMMTTWQEIESIIDYDELMDTLKKDNLKEIEDYLKTKHYQLKLFDHQKNL